MEYCCTYSRVGDVRDVAVDFSGGVGVPGPRSEGLHVDVMLENYSNMLSLELESTYDTKDVFSEKGSFEINFSQWEIKEKSKTFDLEAAIFGNNWKFKKQLEGLQGHQEEYFSQMIINHEKVSTFRKSRSFTPHQSVPSREKPRVCEECGKLVVMGQNLFTMRELTQMRNALSVRNVGRPS